MQSAGCRVLNSVECRVQSKGQAAVVGVEMDDVFGSPEPTNDLIKWLDWFRV